MTHMQDIAMLCFFMGIICGFIGALIFVKLMFELDQENDK
jgi:hypothetical protein